jgi:hypothetical protein
VASILNRGLGSNSKKIKQHISAVYKDIDKVKVVSLRSHQRISSLNLSNLDVGIEVKVMFKYVRELNHESVARELIFAGRHSSGRQLSETVSIIPHGHCVTLKLRSDKNVTKSLRDRSSGSRRTGKIWTR